MTTDGISTGSRLRRRASQYLAAGLLDAAQTTLESLLQLTPHDAHARVELAGVIRQRGRLRASLHHLLQVANTLPDDIQLIVELIRRLYFNGEIVAARACMDHPAMKRQLSASMLATQGQLRWMFGEMASAKALMEQALAAGVDTPDALYLHAMLCQYAGDIRQADTVLQDYLHRWPDSGDAAVALTNLRTQTPASNHLDTLQAQLRRIPANSPLPADRFARANFESARFKELDDLGRHAEAWSALAASNALMHALSPYDEVGESAVTEALIRSSQAIGTKPANTRAAFDGPIPIFIVGMPRSGTTLLDRMISSHSQVVSAGEINDFRRQLLWMSDVPASGVQGMLKALERSPTVDFAEWGSRYLMQTQWRAQGRRYYIDKLPINVRMVPFIHRALPHAPILHMVREPMDTCFSNLKAMLGPASAYSYYMPSLAHYYRQYARLTAHWRSAFPKAVLDVSYTALVTDPETTLRGVLAHCGLAMEDACLHPERNAAPVATPSSAQVREAVHTRSLGEWRHYEAQLEPLRLALAEACTLAPSA
jgi:tetratricopeptide (TPR) repeat protein